VELNNIKKAAYPLPEAPALEPKEVYINWETVKNPKEAARSLNGKGSVRTGPSYYSKTTAQQ
jgi:hypothetical protein